jgi:hypothetical protein
MSGRKKKNGRRGLAKNWRDANNERNQDWINNREKPSEIVTKIPTKQYRDGWDRIFGNKKKQDES